MPRKPGELFYGKVNALEIILEKVFFVSCREKDDTPAGSFGAVAAHLPDHIQATKTYIRFILSMNIHGIAH